MFDLAIPSVFKFVMYKGRVDVWTMFPHQAMVRSNHFHI